MMTPLLVSFYSCACSFLAAFYDAVIIVIKLVVLCCHHAADDVAKIKKLAISSYIGVLANSYSDIDL
jgi:hypothetical protein